MKAARPWIVALTSVTLIALELVWTRLFSAEFFYTFAFLALSLAVLGLGLGGLALRLVPAFDRERRLPLLLALTAVTALVGPPIVFRLGMDFALLFSQWHMAARFVLVLVLLGLPFFFGGMALTFVFKHDSADIPHLYMADLLGAGLGVVVAITAMNALGTPAAVLWIPLPALVAALVADGRRGWIVPLALWLGMAATSGDRAARLLEAGREERAPVVYKHWDAMAKIKVYDYEGQARGINIDNVANSPVLPFDGDWAALGRDSTYQRWAIDVGWLVDRFPRCRFLSLGAGGGADVLQALEKGAAEVHAVEVIPHVNRMMTVGDPSGYVVRDSTTQDSAGNVVTCAAYSGHLYRDPRVKVVTEDARTYVRRHRGSFDVIYSLSSNTWAALGSGAFALAENYLFTTEAFQDYWRALSDGGFLSLEHQMYMPRLVSEALDALRREGVARPEEHIAVYRLPQMRRHVLLLSKRPLTDEIRQRAYGPLAGPRQTAMHLVHPAPDSLRGRIIHQVVTRGWRAVADTARVALSPCTDDRPFIAQMGLWRNLTRERLARVSPYDDLAGLPISQLILALIVAVTLLLALPLVLLPYATSREKLPAAGWLYFLLIGMAFMAVEVVLIQRYTLLLGASVYSTATVLLTLLVAAGLGSRLAGRVPARTAFVGILGWLLLEAFVLPFVTAALGGLPVAARIAATAALVAPLGFFMGMPFPRGVLRVGPLVDWGFAVNGVGSVLGATLVVAVAMAFGFRVALLGGALLYLAAFALLAAEGAWRVRTVPAPDPSASEAPVPAS
jgi:hypothetical protein